MERATLQATKRQETGTRAARRLRHDGHLPAVLYGRQRDTVHLTIALKDFEHVFHAGARLLDLEIGGTLEPAIIRELQYDALGDHVLHVDFARVAMGEALTISVPVELHGLAQGVTHGGTLDHVLVDLEISCLPKDIVAQIRVEVADLDIGQIIHVRDIEPPPGVEFLHDPDTPVVTIHAPVQAVEAEPEVEAELEAAPEVIGGRREKEGEDEERPTEG